jgi:hypothetical protein
MIAVSGIDLRRCRGHRADSDRTRQIRAFLRCRPEKEMVEPLETDDRLTGPNYQSRPDSFASKLEGRELARAG